MARALSGTTWYDEVTSATLTSGSLKEDVLNVITTISPTDTPFLSHIGRSRAISVVHIAPYDTLAARTTTGATEGASWTDAAIATPLRAVNYCQIFRQDWGISGTAEAVARYGMSSPYRYHLEKAMKQLANNVERSILMGVANIGTSSTSPIRYTGGLSVTDSANGGVLSSSVLHATGAAATFTQTELEGMLQKSWTYGGSPDAVYSGPYMKRGTILLWTTNTRNVEADTNALYGNVDVFDSFVGRVRWYLTRDMTDTSISTQPNTIACVQTDLFKFAVLREENIPLQRQGDQLRGTIITEGTLECRNPYGGAWCLTGLHGTLT